jgi:hypothetical protein
MSAGEATETPAPPAAGPEPPAGEAGARVDDRAKLEERRRDAYRVG